ncbi:hypothetical protein GALMADRAFT_209384 [Galerina marginata CBS 339.88]|uniref:Uncharacterized protein n=1 Tax=Galerina marginata (strain CBS 339.88) TaxID=685588 RepID=A0A067TFX7_GALM3|nr:hypothetical protein GALMADRAFT_209384 [Galerina marginata CBS 339.88]
MEDSAPLLNDIGHSNDQFEEDTNISAKKAPDFKAFKITILILSAVALAILIADFIIIKHGPFIRYSWVKLPILLHITIDSVLVGGIVSQVFRLIDEFPVSDWCIPWGRMPNPPADPKCEHWKLVVKILTVIGAVFGAIIGISYIGLLVFRCVAIFRTRFWRTPLTWSFPAGEISFQISMKVMPQNVETAQSRKEENPESTKIENGELTDGWININRTRPPSTTAEAHRTKVGKCDKEDEKSGALEKASIYKRIDTGLIVEDHAS